MCMPELLACDAHWSVVSGALVVRQSDRLLDVVGELVIGHRIVLEHDESYDNAGAAVLVEVVGHDVELDVLDGGNARRPRREDVLDAGRVVAVDAGPGRALDGGAAAFEDICPELDET